MKQRRPTVFRFILQAHAVAVSGMSAAETGGYFRALLRDLECGKGSTPQATEMIEYAKQISKVRSMAGLASAKARSKSTNNPNNLSPAAPPRPAPRSNTHVPTVEQVMAHATTIGLPEAEANSFFEYWQNANWTENNGIPVLNWRKKMANWKTTAAERKAVEAEKKKRSADGSGPRKPSTYHESQNPQASDEYKGAF